MKSEQQLRMYVHALEPVELQVLLRILLEHTENNPIAALETVEMETRDGAQWTIREINEYVRGVLTKVRT